MSIAPKQQLMTRTSVQGTFSRAISGLLLAALVAACASSQSAASDVRQRAQARWDAVLAGDYDTAYGLYSPGYRSSHSRVDFEIEQRMRRVKWSSAEVQESSCEADVCTVVTRIGYQVAGAVPGLSQWQSEKDVKERWLRTDGQWWYLPEE
jgi:hypothetical protein